jgi:2-C-methyl-D-erythritol 4-phosphate cytidylyltransferase
MRIRVPDTQPPAARLTRVAVVLAGGTGTRVGLAMPKQLLTIAGKPIIEHTIARLQESPTIDEILVMMAPGHLDPVMALVRAGGYSKVIGVLEGAGTRNDTTRAAIMALTARFGEDADCHMILHDAVRPLVSETILEANVVALEHHDAVDTAIGSADTVIRVGGEGADEHILDVLPRAELRRGQTPQSFRLSVLRRAYELADADPEFTATDDCTVVLRYLPDVPIAVVPGHESNMKITEPIDVFLADKLFQLNATHTTRLDDDALRTALTGRTVVLFGGSYGIGAAIGDLARSYGADVRVFSRSQTGTHVERRSDIAAAAVEVLADTGRVDYVVNTAGVLPRNPIAETTEETVYNATEVNYLAPVWIAQEFHRHLAATRGSLLLFTSSSYTRGRAGYSLYSSAKAAVVNLTQALADEWADDGIRVNCINPERTATPMRERAFGVEPSHTLLAADTVARAALQVLIVGITGHVVDVRRHDLEL